MRSAVETDLAEWLTGAGTCPDGTYCGVMADASVRPAHPDDAPEIARVQIQTWREAYRSTVPPTVLDTLDERQATESWRSAIIDPPSTRHRVLAALELDRLVGFSAMTPGETGDPADMATIAILLVEPRFGRRGHGSRLLAAAVEHLRGDGFARATTWLLARDQVSQGFYRSAGWDADGAARALNMAGTEVDEIRLHAAL